MVCKLARRYYLRLCFIQHSLLCNDVFVVVTNHNHHNLARCRTVGGCSWSAAAQGSYGALHEYSCITWYRTSCDLDLVFSENTADIRATLDNPVAIINICFEVCAAAKRSEEHTSELQSLMRISYAVFCLKKKK